MSEVQRWNPFSERNGQHRFVAAADYDALRAEVADLRQFHSWAEPQILSHGVDTLEIERLRAEVERLTGILQRHNDGCQDACGHGDQEAVECKYRPYFVASGRRCPECPVYDIIEFRLPPPQGESRDA